VGDESIHWGVGLRSKKWGRWRREQGGDFSNFALPPAAAWAQPEPAVGGLGFTGEPAPPAGPGEPVPPQAVPIGRGGSPNGEPPGLAPKAQGVHPGAPKSAWGSPLGSRNWARTLRTGGAARGARNGEDGVENQRARESKRDFQEEQNFLGPPLNTKAGWAQTSPPLAFWSFAIGAILEKKGRESQGRDFWNPALAGSPNGGPGAGERGQKLEVGDDSR
jgi:hypothetical protein